MTTCGISDLYPMPDLALQYPTRHLFWHGNCLCAPSVMVRGAALDMFQGRYPFDGGYSDYYMWLIISAHYRVAVLNEALTYYRRHSASMSANETLKDMREVYDLRRYVFDHFHEVREAVGGRSAERRLDGNGLFITEWCLRRGDIGALAWSAAHVADRRSTRLWLLFTLVLMRALAQSAADAVAARVRWVFARRARRVA